MVCPSIRKPPSASSTSRLVWPPETTKTIAGAGQQVDVGARSHLGDDPAEAGVQELLIGDHVGAQRLAVLHHGDAGLVTRRLDAQYQHVRIAFPDCSRSLPGPDLARFGDAPGQLGQTPTVLRGLQALSPHDQGVLAGLGIVVLADADRSEAELVVERL